MVLQGGKDKCVLKTNIRSFVNFFFAKRLVSVKLLLFTFSGLGETPDLGSLWTHGVPSHPILPQRLDCCFPPLRNTNKSFFYALWK